MKRKIKNPMIAWLRRNADYIGSWSDGSEYSKGYFYGQYSGRHIRYNVDDGRMDIGDGDFDRWANSVACHFKVDLSKSVKDQVENALIFAKSLKGNCTYIDMADGQERGGASLAAVRQLQQHLPGYAA